VTPLMQTPFRTQHAPETSGVAGDTIGEQKPGRQVALGGKTATLSHLQTFLSTSLVEIAAGGVVPQSGATCPLQTAKLDIVVQAQQHM